MKRMKFAAALAAVSIALFTSCQKKDVNAPSVELFQKVILSDPAAKQQICTSVISEMTKLPQDFQDFEQKLPKFEKFRILQRLGYVTAKPSTVTGSFGTQQQGVRVELTDKGKTAFQSEFRGQRCFAEWQAQTVKNYTEPAEIAGVKTSQVTVTGQQNYFGWATDPQLRKLLYVPDLPETAEKTVTLMLKNTGWAVSGVQK